jgi:hypothetical protein
MLPPMKIVVPFIVAAAFACAIAACGNESPKPEKSSGGAAGTSTSQGSGNAKPDGGTQGATVGAGGW